MNSFMGPLKICRELDCITLARTGPQASSKQGTILLHIGEPSLVGQQVWEKVSKHHCDHKLEVYGVCSEKAMRNNSLDIGEPKVGIQRG